VFSIVKGMSDQQRPMLHLALHVAPAVLSGTRQSVARSQGKVRGDASLVTSLNNR
jgi:hypothetical protein